MPKQTFFNLPYFKRNLIINNTYDLFINNDYKDITIRAIAKNANISIGSFYQYFEDKDDMYLYLIIAIEEKVFMKFKELHGTIFTEKDDLILEKILSPKELAFDNTWYNAPIEVMMKFYFGKFSRKLNHSIYIELQEYKNKGKLKDFVDVELVFYHYVTSMFNMIMYFRENNITDEEVKTEIKNNFYIDVFLHGILKKEA
ncbi:TetR/AcrR family transcriptional regulator [Clostridium sp. 'deep sea']|uniref:TetR/AcrR family transcriptional regulator n=1 Tax=Clostridium sp. 'deep sea' TaxID=2779445 RepID=UPI00189654CE|nr:TetR/AcrR family transcriptional regulator [Clostridium sp. 'deep sea']QOR36243.1 TetR/AcrR family transcriptional regulator [Clostridium sp. 'deep sea']